MTLLLHNRTYGSIEHDGKAWRIVECEPHVALKLKAIFPRIGKTARPPFVISGGPNIDADLSWFLLRYPMVISGADRLRLEERKTLFETGLQEIATLLSPDWRPSGAPGFRGNMRPYTYQAQAAELARRTGRLLLMDDLGLGKTVSALATITNPECLPALVVPQTHLVKQWVEKIAEFTTLTSHVIARTKPYELPKADVYVCPYSKLAGWIDYAETAGFKSVVFDEMQELRNGTDTAKGEAAMAFRQGVDVALGLTATPIYNYGSEIFRIVNVLEEGCLGSWDDFKNEWCDMGPGGKWIVNDPQALGTFLREQHLALRRSNDDVGAEYPPLNVIIRTIPFDEEVLDREEVELRELALKVINGTFVERGQAAREFDLALRKATGVSKAPHVAEFVKVLMEAHQPVVLFGWHRDVYDIWLKRLAKYKPILFTGSETPSRKEKAKRAFVEGDTNLIIMSLRSGAGVDGLQYRSHVAVFGELDWSPQVHAQCCGRLRRPGQERQVDAIYLHADGGTDPTVVGVLGLKASQSAGILDPLAAPAEQHSDVTRIRQLAELYLAGQSHTARPAVKATKPKRVAQASLL